MTAISDALNSQADADAAQRLLEGCVSDLHESEGDSKATLVFGLAVVAICERINALTMRLAYEIEASRAQE